jgi:hypothetical protein
MAHRHEWINNGETGIDPWCPGCNTSMTADYANSLEQQAAEAQAAVTLLTARFLTISVVEGQWIGSCDICGNVGFHPLTHKPDCFLGQLPTAVQHALAQRQREQAFIAAYRNLQENLRAWGDTSRDEPGWEAALERVRQSQDEVADTYSALAGEAQECGDDL